MLQSTVIKLLSVILVLSTPNFDKNFPEPTSAHSLASPASGNLDCCSPPPTTCVPDTPCVATLHL